MKSLNIFASTCFIIAAFGVSLFADDVTLTIYDNASALALDTITVSDNISTSDNTSVYNNLSTFDNASTFDNSSLYDNLSVYDNSSALALDNVSVYDNDNVSLYDNLSFEDNTTLLADEPIFNDEDILRKMCRAKQVTPHTKRYISLVTENDAYFNPYIDRYYSAGNRLTYTSPEKNYYCDELLGVENGDNVSSLAWISKFALFSAPSVSRWTIGLGQEIFTPSYRIGDPIFQPNHPYGGYLYFMLGITNRSKDIKERFTLNIGVVGPLSLGQVFQDFIHIYGHLGAKLNGWDTQLSNEPIFNLQYFLTTRNSIFETKYVGSDFLHSINLALGNAHTYAGTSLRLRIGYNLDNDFGVSKLNHATDSGMPHSDRFSVYFFGGIGAKLVAKNIFISGNTFRIGTGLELNNLIYELELGVAVSYKGFRASYMFSRRSKEFASQKFFSDFGTIILDVAF